MNYFTLFICLVIMLFSFVIVFGAPYLPTRKQELNGVLKYINKANLVYELGSGDGRVQIFLAKNGIRSVGVEINPILFLICYLRLLPYRKYATIKFGNFWKLNLQDADVVFVFLLQKYMNKLNTKIIHDRKQQKTRLISIGFNIPSKKPLNNDKNFFIYDI